MTFALEYVYTIPHTQTAAIRFIRDPDKAASNKRKHGLDFSLADVVFADPLHVIVYDRHEAGEDRWHCLGVAGGDFRVLLVVHCHPDPHDPDLVRVIGLRQATAHERRRYEDG